MGRGTFNTGVFQKLAKNNSVQVGGMVTVGPFSKYDHVAQNIRDAAFEKFCATNRQFRHKFKKAHSTRFSLVYEDGTIVSKLPDGSGDFTLSAYRQFLDPKLKYERLRLYLCETGNIHI